MVARGRVRNGVVVLDDGTLFPEGQSVTVLAHSPENDLVQPARSDHHRRVPVREIAAGAALPNTRAPSHSVLDILPVSLGPLLRPFAPGDDLLGEMLEDRS